jgi:hypothetical protein
MPVSFCTAEGVGSSPIGSTLKSRDLQVKHEIWVEAAEQIRGLVLQPILQRTLRNTGYARTRGIGSRSLPRLCTARESGGRLTFRLLTTCGDAGRSRPARERRREPRHVPGLAPEWLPPEDACENGPSVLRRSRIQGYHSTGKDSHKVWVVTETDRTPTRVLLPNRF